MPDAIGEGRFTFDGEGNIIAVFAGWRPYTHYRISGGDMLEAARRFWAMHAKCARLTELAARFDEEADDTARIAVERWEELRKWRDVAAGLVSMIDELCDEWPEDYDRPNTRDALWAYNDLVAKTAVAS